jgi:hypothetical protein
MFLNYAPLKPAHITQPINNSEYFNPEDGDSIFLHSVGIHLQDYTVSQPWKSLSEYPTDIYCKLAIWLIA